MVTNLSVNNSIVGQWMSELRSAEIQQDRWRFRNNMQRFGMIAAYEISKQLDYTSKDIVTPMGELPVNTLQEAPVLATILRAGIPLHQGLLDVFDQADCAFIAAFRKHHRDGSFEIEQNYVTCPSLLNRVLIIADPMLATGASVMLALDTLQEYGPPQQVHVVSTIACTEGIEKVLRKFPEVHIWVGDIDDELTAKGYIVPGLGDAGDLSYGNKEQN
jgi:uracil phosphoribosyltransferase